jgi:hypothetical protein
MRSLIRNKLHKNYWDYLNNMLDPQKDNNSTKFWKYIKSRKQDTMGIGTLKNNGELAFLHWLKWRVSFLWHIGGVFSCKY